MSKWIKMISIALVAVVLGSLAVSAVAFAQGPDNGLFGGRQGRPGFGGPGGPGGPPPFVDRDTMDAALADALGISVDELQAQIDSGKRIPEIIDESGVDPQVVRDAMDAARDAALDQAVADGKLTQEQADQIRERGPQGHPDGPPPFVDRDTMDAALADALGISVDELQAQIDSGKRIPEIIDESGVDPQVVRDAMDAARDAALDQAVADGKLTQEQADQIRERGPQGHPGGPPPFADRDTMDAALADALGISVDELRTQLDSGKRIPEIIEESGVDPQVVRDAMDAARDAALDQAVADGKLTQEQADQIRERGPQGHPGGPPPFADRDTMDAALADALGISVDELQAQIDSGKRIPEIIDESGVDPQVVRDAMDAARDAALDQAVADGKLTQEQADQIQERGANGPQGHRGPGGQHGRPGPQQGGQ